MRTAMSVDPPLSGSGLRALATARSGCFLRRLLIVGLLAKPGQAGRLCGARCAPRRRTAGGLIVIVLLVAACKRTASVERLLSCVAVLLAALRGRLVELVVLGRLVVALEIPEL